VLFLLKRKPKLLAAPQHQAAPAARRNRQQNIKVSQDCLVAFAELTQARRISKAALFEDMVAERLEKLQRQGRG
jgi:hypothetical protein